MSDGYRLQILRDARLFVRHPDALERLEPLADLVPLEADQLAHPDEAADLVLRRGRVRVAEFLPDGREIGRAVLQAGSCLTVRREAGDLSLETTTIMALGSVELWLLPPGTLAAEGLGVAPAAEVKR